MADDGKSWVEKLSGISAPKSAGFSNPNLRDSGGWVERQSGVAAPEGAKSYSERMAGDAAVEADSSAFDRTEYFAPSYINGRVRENDYSEIPAGGGGTNLPFQISGGGDSWSVSGGRVNNAYVYGASFIGRNLEFFIDVENKQIVSEKKNSESSHYVPIGKVVEGVGEGYLTSNILTSSGSGCQFFYWGI